MEYKQVPKSGMENGFWHTKICYCALIGGWLAGFWCSNSELQLQLQLHEKTEAMLIGTRQKLSSISVNTLQLDNTTVPLSDSVKSLSVLVDSTQSMENLICQTSESCYTSSIDFPVRLQRNWSPHSHCHTSTTAVIYCLADLLPLSTTIIGYRTVLLTSYWKNVKTEHTTPLFQWSISPLPGTGSQSSKEFGTR